MRKIILSLLLALSCCYTARSTTIVVMVLPNSILVGSDGKTLDRAIHSNGSQTISPNRTRKIFVLNNRFAIASTGISTVTSPDGRKVYDFADWSDGIQKELSSNTSVDQLAGLVEARAADFSSFFEQYLLKRGLYPPPAGQVLETCRPLVQYVVVGNQGGVSKVFVIHLDIDWKNLVLSGPDKIDLNADPDGKWFNNATYILGINAAIRQLENQKSYAYKQMTHICPEEMKLRKAGQPLSLQQAKRYIRALIKIEKDVEPNEVGENTQVVTIPIGGGKAEFETFDKEVEASLPRQTLRRQ